MDAAHIDMQVLSLTSPGTEQLEAAEVTVLARDTNDYLADAMRKHPARLSGFASLPTAAPDKAAQELERRVHEQKFVGAVISGPNRGRYLDDKFFLADPGMRRETWSPDLSPPHTAAKACHRGVIQRLCTTRNADARGPGLGLAHRNCGSHHSPHPRRHIRPLSQIAGRSRSHGRRPTKRASRTVTRSDYLSYRSRAQPRPTEEDMRL